MIYLWFSAQFNSIGHIASENFDEVYDFFTPDSQAYKIRKLDLNFIDLSGESSINRKSYYRKLYEKSKESYTFNNQNELWKWFFEKYMVEIL